PAVTVNDDAGELPSSHTFHNVAVASDGTVLVSWIDSRTQDRAEFERSNAPADSVIVDPGPEIRFARSLDTGASFTPSIVVDQDPCPCCRTSIVSGPDGSVHIAWRKHFGGDVRDVVVATASAGSADFGPPVRVYADD